MGSFTDHLVLYTSQSVENDSAGATFDIVDGLVDREDSDHGWDNPSAEEVIRHVRHGCGTCLLKTKLVLIGIVRPNETKGS